MRRPHNARTEASINGALGRRKDDDRHAACSGCCRHMSLAVHQSDSKAFDGNLVRRSATS